MAATLVDNVRVNVTSMGTGALSLGSAVDGYRGIEALQNGKTYNYKVVAGWQWEIGQGQYLTSGNQLIRTPLHSSNGDGLVSLPQNSQVSFVALASDFSGTDLSQEAIEAKDQAVLAASQAQDAAAQAMLIVEPVAAIPTDAGAGVVGTADGGTVQGFINRLLSSAGSAVLGFIQAGAGAVMRSIQDELRVTISVKQFGAKGDGSTDDTAAIQKAVDYAQTIAGDYGAVIDFPAGDYVHGNVVISLSGIMLRGHSRTRLLKNTTTGNGIEFKAPNYPSNPNARIYRCGMQGFMLGNALANGTAGANVYFQNVQDATVTGNKYGAYPFKPFTAFRFERCTNATYTDVKGSDATGTGVVFQECGGIFGNSNTSNACGVDGWEFDTCTGNYLKTIQGYGNTRYGAYIRSTISSSNISDQSAYYLIESWDMDSNGSHNWSINDLHESNFTGCWGSSQTGTTIDLAGFAIGGTSSDIDLIGCKALGNNGPGAIVGSTCVNINFNGGTYANNGKQSGSANRVGIVHQGTGVIQGITAKNIARYGSSQQYGLTIALGANGNMMRVKNCALAGNAAGPITPISATGYTDFAEEGNSTGLSADVASANTLATPTLGRFFNVTGTTDIYDITPKWKGRRVSLTFASTARLIGGTALRITAANLTPGQYGTADLIYTGSEWVLLSSSVNDNT